MKQLSLMLCMFLSLSSSCSFAQTNSAEKNKLVWYTDLMEAHNKSKETHKPIFAMFTGSDWCGWCHKLEHDVFAKAPFIKWAKEKVILLELDFPRNKQLPPQLVQQNNSLQQAFKVVGYPTVWIFFMEKDKASENMSISPLGSLGYPQGAEVGREEVKFLADANVILAKAPK